MLICSLRLDRFFTLFLVLYFSFFLLCAAHTGHASPSSCMQLTPLSPAEFPPPSDAQRLIVSVFGDAGMKVVTRGITSGASSCYSAEVTHEGSPIVSRNASAPLSSSQSLLQSAMSQPPHATAAAASASVALAALTLHLRRLKVRGGGIACCENDRDGKVDALLNHW